MERISNSAVQHSLLLSSPKILPSSSSSSRELATHQEVPISTRSYATSHPTDSGHTTIAKISTLPLYPPICSITASVAGCSKETHGPPPPNAAHERTGRCEDASASVWFPFRRPSVLVLKLDAWRESELRILFCKDAPHIVDSCCWSWSLIRGNPWHGRGFDWGRRRGHVEVDVQYIFSTPDSSRSSSMPARRRRTQWRNTPVDRRF